MQLIIAKAAATIRFSFQTLAEHVMSLPQRSAILVALYLSIGCAASAEQSWRKHVIHAGTHSATAIAADFTGDGKLDVISNRAGKTRLFVAPTVSIAR